MEEIYFAAHALIDPEHGTSLRVSNHLIKADLVEDFISSKPGTHPRKHDRLLIVFSDTSDGMPLTLRELYLEDVSRKTVDHLLAGKPITIKDIEQDIEIALCHQTGVYCGKGTYLPASSVAMI